MSLIDPLTPNHMIMYLRQMAVIADFKAKEADSYSCVVGYQHEAEVMRQAADYIEDRIINIQETLTDILAALADQDARMKVEEDPRSILVKNPNTLCRHGYNDGACPQPFNLCGHSEERYAR